MYMYADNLMIKFIKARVDYTFLAESLREAPQFISLKFFHLQPAPTVNC